MTSSLGAIWEQLEAESLPGGMMTKRVYPAAKVDLFVGLENPGALRTFFVEVPRNAIAGVSRWPSCAGFAVGAEPVGDGKARHRVVVRSRESSSDDLFASVAEDVLAVASTQLGPRETITALVGRLLRWQRFLENHGAHGLTAFEQRGLFGELWFMEHAVLPRCGVAAGLQGWTGPLAKDHDFQLPTLSCEVKTTASNPDHRVHISNIRQLDDGGAAPLVLVHVSLVERNAQARTLVDLVADVRLATGDHVALLNELLTEAGYLDIHAAGYRSTGYIVQSHKAYAVREGFPRMLERDLPPGIGEVSYALSLSACAPFAIEDTTLMSMLGASSP